VGSRFTTTSPIHFLKNVEEKSKNKGDVTVKTSNVFRFFSPSKKTPFHIILPIASQMHFQYKNTVALGRCSVFAGCHVKTSAFWK
jgi:hypothetical protein